MPVAWSHLKNNSWLHSCRIRGTVNIYLPSGTSSITSSCVSLYASALISSCRLKTLTEKASEFSVVSSILQCKRNLLCRKKSRKGEEVAQRQRRKGEETWTNEYRQYSREQNLLRNLELNATFIAFSSFHLFRLSQDFSWDLTLKPEMNIQFFQWVICCFFY